MSNTKNTLYRFLLGEEKMDHRIGHLSSKNGSSFFNIDFKSLPRSKLEEANADFYVSSPLNYQKVHCYFPGAATDTFPVLVTDRRFNVLYIEKDYMDKVGFIN